MVVEVVISSGRLAGTAATIADETVRLFGERLHLAPQDILFVFHEVGTGPPAFSCWVDEARPDRGCLSCDIVNFANGRFAPEPAAHPESLFFRSDNKKQKATRALHRTAFARLSP
jgi:hypothetical protein